MRIVLIGFLLLFGACQPALADEPASWHRAAAPLFTLSPDRDGASGQGGSLFAGRSEGGLFAPWPGARAHPLPLPLSSSAAIAATRIRNLIARAEAGPAGYDAVQWGAAVMPPARPTVLTLAEIDRWIRDTPGQPHAIGRYQFIPKTLRWLIARLDLPGRTRFSPAVQDRMADLLLADAGLQAVLSGEMDRRTFKRNLARTWAGFPLPNGKSFYDGYAGNKATMSWKTFEAQIAQILS